MWKWKPSSSGTFLSFPNGNTRNAPDSFPLPLCKNSADKVLHTENDLLTKKKELESKIATKEEEIRTLKARLSNIVRQHEFATVQDFYTTFYTAQRAFDAYQKERSKWEEAYGEIVTPKFETIHDKIKRYQEKSDNQNANRPYQSKDKGGEIIAPQFHCLIFSKMKFRTLIIKKSH